MNLIQISAITAAVVIVTGLFWYIYLVIQDKIQTVAASWIVSTVALTLSMVTYCSSPNANWLGGSLNAASGFAVLSTLIAVYLRARRNGEKVVFSLFQKKCLIASGFITASWIIIVWGMKGTGVIPNLLTQLLLVISYFMLIKKFWNAQENTESLFTWWCVFLSSVIAIYTGWAKHDMLSSVYAIRSTVMCGFLIFALHRIDWRKRQVALND